jgi:hypothetical protein
VACSILVDMEILGVARGVLLHRSRPVAQEFHVSEHQFEFDEGSDAEDFG